MIFGQAHQKGFTLVELIVAIVVIAIASISAVGLTSALSTRSAQAMVRAQAVLIGSSYLEEVLAKDLGPNPGGANRTSYNDVFDYGGVSDASVRDHRSVLVPGLGNFRVRVSVQPGFALIPSRLVTVTVTEPSGTQIQLQALKTAP